MTVAGGFGPSKMEPAALDPARICQMLILRTERKGGSDVGERA
jgi:hypothetical protein